MFYKKFREIVKPLVEPFSWVLFLFLVPMVSIFFLKIYPGGTWADNFNPFYFLIRWDSWYFLELAQGGYNAGLATWFPLYPWLSMIFYSVFNSFVIAGIFVSFASLFLAIIYYKKLLGGDSEFKTKAVALMLFYPGAIFLGLVYSESLFLLLNVAFFYYLFNKKWLVAAILGFFACLTRNFGIFLWAVYLVFYLLDSYKLTGSWKVFVLKWRSIIFNKNFFFSLIIPLGLASYMLFCFVKFGDPLLFVHQQKAWAEWRKFCWPWDWFRGYYNYIFVDKTWNDNIYSFSRRVLIEFGSWFLLLVATIYWLFKKHWTYFIFCLLPLLVFIFTFPMTSVNRYVCVIFPIFIFLAEVLNKKPFLYYIYLLASFIFYVFNIMLFINGSWVG